MPADYVQANTNGRLHAAHEPSISPLNRGFLYGDAIYEVWRTYQGAIFGWEEHWTRLQQSARALGLGLPLTLEQLAAEVRRTAAEFRRRGGGAGELYVRLQVTRGEGAIGLDPALAGRADYVLLVQANRDFPPKKVQAGLRLSLARELRRNDRRTLDPAWKTGNYLNNLLCLREARGLLAGVTRRVLIERVAPAAGVAVRETALKLEDVDGMQECFLTSTTKDITPVAAIDERRFQVGPASVALRLKAAFGAYARAYAAAHPELLLD